MKSSPLNSIGSAHFSSGEQEHQPQRSPGGRVCVFFASKEGHTQEIARRIALDLHKHGFDVDLHNVRMPFPFHLSDYSAAILAASVHQGNHEPEMIQFVKGHRAELDRMPTAFLSVTLSEAGAEMKGRTAADHEQFVADVKQMLETFFKQTGWHPTTVKPVAGALLYSKYNFLIRFLMKRIARKAGASTDASRDYDYTDWIGLDRFVEEWGAEINAAQKTESLASAKAG